MEVLVPIDTDHPQTLLLELDEEPVHPANACMGSSDTELSRVVTELSRELLQSVEEGSAPELLNLLSRIVSTNAQSVEGTTRDRERLELLQGIAMRLRLDLHSMLAQIYQRLEAARAYVSVIRHLAGEWEPSDTQRNPSATGDAHPVRKSAVILSWPRSI